MVLVDSLFVGADAPTLGDARSAAEALLGEGVSEVWLYGSVARGESHICSDIDLVAVFDDLDYRQRLSVTMRLQRVAADACGQHVEVLVTDRAEWRIQREQVTASFACAISYDLILLACSPDLPVEVDWDKDQVMATSNVELAAERLDAVTVNLGKIYANLDPGRSEIELACGDDRLEYEDIRASRMIVICEASQLAVENAAKAVAVLGGVPARQLWIHDIEQLLDSIKDNNDGMSEDLRMLLLSAPELVKHEGYITMWRIRGAYRTTSEGRTAQEIATLDICQSHGTQRMRHSRLQNPHSYPRPRPQRRNREARQTFSNHPTTHPIQHSYRQNRQHLSLLKS